jgi:hypothetical protein
MLIWVRRYRCRDCRHTMSRLPDWLHPWRWYAAAVIAEALWRDLILGETAGAIGFRFGRSDEYTEWRSLRRWRSQLLISPTLWGWLRTRLGAVIAVGNSREQGRRRLMRLLGEMRIIWGLGMKALSGLPEAVRITLRGLVHNRRQAWLAGQFRPEMARLDSSESRRLALATEKDSGPDPPR